MNEFLTNAEKFIAEHLQDEFTLDEIAGFCGYSSFHFARKFKEVVNKTVMEYVREKRILAAAEMIKDGANICNAALEYGFETHAGFTKAFNAVFGCCPRNYAAHCCSDYWKGFDNILFLMSVLTIEATRHKVFLKSHKSTSERRLVQLRKKVIVPIRAVTTEK